MSRKSRQHAPRVPINVTGGIRSQIGRGHRAHHWWGGRWIALMEQFMAGPRVGRGRSYAASGQVTRLEIMPGCVTASVQGAGPEPYRLEIHLPVLNASAKEQTLNTLREQPVLLGRLLACELPQEMEPIFLAAGTPLFPQRREDWSFQCSCPDWGNPCKHAAAVNFLLAEAIDRDPLLLLALHGIDRSDLLGKEHARPIKTIRTTAPAPLTADPVLFWGAGANPAATPVSPDFGAAPECDATAPLMQRLGPLPFWRGEERFLDVMRIIYTRAATRGWVIWSGEPLEPSRIGVNHAGSEAFRLRRRHLNMDVTLR